MKFICTLILNILLFELANAQEPIHGAYGRNDVRIRAGNGAIREGQLKSADFAATGLEKIALIYWPDNQIGQHKIGITVFENKTRVEDVSGQFNQFADSVVITKFNEIAKVEFKKLNINSEELEEYFKLKTIGPGVKLLEPGKAFLTDLRDKGFDGAFILYEHELQDLFTASRTWLPSKGIFKFYKKQLIYHGLYSILLNLETQKPVKNIGYQQISGDYLTKDIDSVELSDIIEDIKVRFVNNIDEIIRIHKLK